MDTNEKPIKISKWWFHLPWTIIIGFVIISSYLGIVEETILVKGKLNVIIVDVVVVT